LKLDGDGLGESEEETCEEDRDRSPFCEDQRGECDVSRGRRSWPL
jgi:hypothetical protein